MWLFKGISFKYGLFMVGSTMCGFATENSDIDMCLLVKPCLNDARSDALSYLHIVQMVLQQSGKPFISIACFFKKNKNKNYLLRRFREILRTDPRQGAYIETGQFRARLRSRPKLQQRSRHQKHAFNELLRPIGLASSAVGNTR